MEEINLEDLMSYFIRNILLIVTVTLAFILSMVIYLMFIKVPVYKSITTIILAGDNKSYDSITASDVTLNQSLVGTYSEVIKSKKVLNQVIENLKLEIGYEDLMKAVTVSNVADTELLKIEVTDIDAKVAMIIANEVAEVFTSEIVNIYSLENISIVDVAEESLTPSNDNAITQIALAALAGIFISSGVIFLVYYFDKRIKTKEEVEKITGLPVLGMIPLNREVD